MVINIKQFFDWLKPVFVIVFLLVIVFLFLLYIEFCSVTEFGIRVFGFIFQFVGIASTYLQLRNAKFRFRLPGWYDLVVNWWRLRPRLLIKHSSKPEMGKNSGDPVLPSFSAYGIGRNDASVDEKIKQLETVYFKLNLLHHELEEKMERRLEEILQTIFEEKVKIESKIIDLSDLLKKHSTDGIYVSIVVVGYILFGMLLTTFSGEVAKFIS